MFGVSFAYSVSFDSHTQEVYICNQVFGFNACGPYNCSNTYTFDSATCQLNFTVSSCEEQVAKQHTDMHVQSLTYNQTDDTVIMGIKSNTPGASGPIVLSLDTTTTLQCPPADTPNH
eukprot:c11361_g1_i1.p1 GENE.c11361_g1_i1~~c11361_g1_i1.p1  ORF type:complete len:117 (+),score=33.65 c11361_g1_i1:318-668(+)